MKGFSVPRMQGVTVLLWIAACLAGMLYADVQMPNVLGDHMVLQRGKSIPVWGWAEPGEAILVSLGGNEQKTEADERGLWRVDLPKMKAGGPHEMVVAGRNRINLRGVLVGEVWLCGGQSNMAEGLFRVAGGAQEAAAAKHPNLRLFRLRKRRKLRPLLDANAHWAPCTPYSATTFSAVAYFFGRRIQTELDVPVGLICNAIGATRIEPWTPLTGFEKVPELAELFSKARESDRKFREDFRRSLTKTRAWLEAARKALEAGGSPSAAPSFPRPRDRRHDPSRLSIGWVEPLVPFALRGAIWYQGESNLEDGMAYYHKMCALIVGWRTLWKQGDFPFYYVQLAPCRRGKPMQLPGIWEAQTRAFSLPNTGMAVVNDIRSLDNVHPPYKKLVGERLARLALAKTYGRKLVPMGPIYRSMSVEGSRIRVRFDYVGSGLASRDGKTLTWFEVAPEDRKFMKASAKIDGNDVLVWSEDVPKPMAVRFGWHREAEPNLINKGGLPASSFRTHPW